MSVYAYCVRNLEYEQKRGREHRKIMLIIGLKFIQILLTLVPLKFCKLAKNKLIH